MPYPNEIDNFTDKLNKSDTVYVIEEEVELTNGVYEGLLIHDNLVDSSVHVYTGPKLTGTKVDNFILSIPSKEKWRRSIKIFSSVSPVYITYESYGDQIEADDINRLQASTTATQTEVNRYKAANDLVVTNTVNRVTKLEQNKAEKTYVDSELLKKADKTNTYTKTETDARIQAVVDAAPAALDTLNEIAAALNDDPNFAATMTTELSKKVDKVTGKQLSTEDYSTAEKTKLAGIEANANKYVHPSTHPATMIVEDSTHRFSTDAEKANWNGKETPDGAQAKVDAHATNVTAHVTAAERTAWNAKSNLALGETATTAYRGDYGKTAYTHSQTAHAPSNAQKNSDITKAEIEAKLTGNITTHSHSHYVTTEQLGNAGYGDMLKAVYDIDGDGIVDAAASVPWAGVTGKPSTFTPSSHNHTIIQRIDDRDRKPADTTKGFVEFVFTSLAGMSGTANSDYQDMFVLNTHIDTTGGNANALLFDKSEKLIRHYQAAQSATSWGIPKTLSYAEDVMKKGPLTWNDLKGV